MRRSLVGTRDEVLPFRHFADRATSFGKRIGFRFLDGRMKSLPYTHLVETEFNPDVGIILDFVGYRVVIYGRNLVNLYTSFEEEEVGEVTEHHANEIEVPPGTTYIRRIEWERI